TAYSKVQKGAASADRINMIMQAENHITEVENPHIFNQFIDKIEYKNVSFAYGTELVLRNINFTIEKGKTIA
ncbi:MAG TPA: ABC transporter ATP-binding protein, partial [Vicingus sp.]|nr:ABC transporter ATP-binding protein [Vicingus sp.]